MTTEKHVYQLIDKNSVNAAWNGSPTTVLVNQNVAIPQTPNGTTVFSATNLSPQNNQGTISLTSGGGAPLFLDIPALVNEPTIKMNNWQANNLSVTNLSPNNSTPILVQAVGPGMPGITPQALPIGGQGVALAAGQCAQGNASPQYMQLLIQSTAPTLGILAIIGGKVDHTSGNNGYVIAINADSNTGPNTGVPAPAGYYATTTGNSYAFQFNWGSSQVFVSNLSPSTAQALTVLLRAL